MIPQNAIFEITRDQEWHELSEFLHLAREHVPPEKAHRAYLAMFHEHQAIPDIQTDQMIAKGRQRYTERCLAHLVRKGVLISQGRGFAKRYKQNADHDAR